METLKKQVAVIILNWNGANLLREFLPSVIENTNDALADIIVADNGSSDRSYDVLTEEFPQVQVITFEKNHGFALGYNLALELTKYEYTVLLNSDVAPAPGWLDPLYNFMVDWPEAGGCQPKLLSYKARDTFEYAGACGGFLDRNGYPYCRGRIFSLCEKDRHQYDTPREIDWASGAALMVRTQAYLDAGGLDPLFFAHMEEIDLCWRMRLKGWKFYVVPDSVCYHLGGGSLPASNPKKTYLNFRNNLLMLYKNLPKRIRGRKLIKRRLLDTLAWAKFIITFDFANSWALLRAHRDFSRMKSTYSHLNAHKNLLEDRPNILTEFYLKRRHKFSSIYE